MKKQTQNILISMIIAMLLISNAVLANDHDPHHSYLFNIQVNDPTYGKLNGNYALTMDVLDDNNNIIWTSQENAVFMQGISEFSFIDDSFIKDGATSLRITIPEIEHTDVISLNAVPYATHAKHAKQVYFDNVTDMPSSILFFKDNVSTISDSNTKELIIINDSNNNNTASTLSLSSDNGDNYVNISSLKNNQGQLKTQINSKDDIEFYRDGKLVLKLGEDNFEMNGYSNLTESDISNMGFINSETQVDEFVNNNGYLTSTDMSDYVEYDDLNFAGANYQTSAASMIGVYDEFDNSDSILIQDVLDDLDQAISDIDISDNLDTTITDLGYIKDTLTESQVDAMANDNGYASASSVTNLENSLGDLAYKNESDELRLNEIHVETLKYGTIEQESAGVVEYSTNDSNSVKYSGVAMMASGWVQIPANQNLKITLPFNWRGGVVNLMCNHYRISSEFMGDHDSAKTFVSTHHALTNINWNDHTTVTQILGNDNATSYDKDQDTWCNIKQADDDSFTLYGHSSIVSVSWWVTAPSKID